MQPACHMQIDSLSMLMCMIAAFIGGLICIYAVGYMKAYHQHHKEFQDRSGFFFSMLFLFLAAMLRFGTFGESHLDVLLLGR